MVLVEGEEEEVVAEVSRSESQSQTESRRGRAGMVVKTNNRLFEEHELRPNRLDGWLCFDANESSQ